MQLIFKNIKNTNEFGNWLKGFKDILSSLLIEIDLIDKVFVAKGFPDTKAIVKYSVISFEDAGFELTSIKDNDGNIIEDWSNLYANAFENGNRVKIGLYNLLPDFNSYIGLFHDTDYETIIEFDRANDVKYIGDTNITTEYQVTDVIFKSLLLTMHVKCSAISEFFYRCSDDIFFNNVCKMETPCVFEISPESLSNLTKIISVVKSSSKSSIKFYTKVKDEHLCLYAYDETGGTYDYVVGVLDKSCDISNINEVHAHTVVSRDYFMSAIKSADNNHRITFALDQYNSVKLLVSYGNTKVVVASIMNS